MAAPARAAALSAFVLHRYEWSESSLILDLFTRERGRLAVAAKGARRPYSQLRPILLPFQRVSVTLGKAPADPDAEIFTLRQAEWGGGAPSVGGGALFAGFHLNELLMRLLARQDPHPALFDAYAATLPALAGGEDARAQAALRAFELLLLRETGVLPDLTQVTLTLQPLSDGEAYQLRPDSGLVRVATGDDGPDLAAPTLLALEAALSAGDLGALQKACLDALVPLRSSLRALLHYHAGAALRTRQVLLGVQRLLETPPSPAR